MPDLEVKVIYIYSKIENHKIEYTPIFYLSLKNTKLKTHEIKWE